MKLSYFIFPISIICLLSSCSSPTKSIDLINTEASLPADFDFGKMGLKVITSFIDNEKNGSTMSTLYGNDLALASSKARTEIKPGEIFALITWKQQEDRHWFGAKIPAGLKSLEMVKTSPNGKTAKIAYQRFEGPKLILNKDTSGNTEREKYILEQQPSVMP